MVRSGSGTPRRINLEPEIAYEPGQFNLNGIVSRRGGRELIVVSSFSQSLYRIRLHAPNGPRGIRKIDAPKLEGDGLLMDRGRLLVVTRDPAAVAVLSLRHRDLRARIAWVRTHPSLRGPSTVARTPRPLPGGQRGLRHGATAVHGLIPGSSAPLTTGRSSSG